MYKKYLINLRKLILRECEINDYTFTQFAGICGISLRELQKITSGETFRMRIDILVKHM